MNSDQEAPSSEEGRRSHLQVVADVLQERGLAKARIGTEKKVLPVVYYEKLCDLLPEATLVAADPVFARTRAIKTDAEVEILHRAAHATEKAVLKAFQNASPGDTEKKVGDEIRDGLYGDGADDVVMTLGAGPNVKVFHQPPGPKQLLPGEPIHFDGGGLFDGYYSDLARVALVGPAKEGQLSRYKWLYEAMRDTIARCRSGVTGGELYNQARSAYEKAGYDIFSELVGHSIGINLHEWPVFHADDADALQPGMVLQIEQGLDDGYDSRFHIEDLVLVTEAIR